MRPRVVFLEASDEAIINRFRETRRPHPLSPDGTVVDGIERERAELADARARADVVIDTTGLSIWDLRRRVAEALMAPGGGPRIHVQFVSFGYKHGVPRDADLLFDVRFLQNPHYVPALNPLTGLDPAVAEFVAAAPGMEEFRARLESLLDFLLPAYADEGKASVVIGIGCTGGRHRSVAIAEMLAQRYSRDFDVSTSHRHVDALHRRAHRAGVMSRQPRIAALGGGTGLASLLRGLKRSPLDITAIVTVADDGGSSGRLRRELGVLPPGDIRNCLVALADDESLMGRLFQHRFADGDLSGHPFGNLFLAALAEVTGNFDLAIEECSRVLKIRGPGAAVDPAEHQALGRARRAASW